MVDRSCVFGWWISLYIVFWDTVTLFLIFDVEEYSFVNETLNLSTNLVLDVLDVSRSIVTSQSLSVLYVNESPVEGTMYCHPYTGQGREWCMVELVSG